MNGFLPFLLYFLVVSAVTALVQSMVREGQPGRILSEATHFFLLIVGGIGAFSLVVFALEWAFIRNP